MPILYDDRFIKQPHIEEEFSIDQIQTLARCATDINYFLQFVQIVTLDKGRQRFDPYQYQKDLINMFNNNRWNIALLSRQSGKSTTVGAWALQYAIFNRDKFIGIVSNKEKAAKDILRRIKLMYTELPFWMKPGVVEWNKTAIEFDNGTRIEVSATSESAFRGRSINVLIMDEFAFVPPGQAEEFWAANYPALSASVESKLIIISTPNGMFNLFHQLYTAAEKKINAFAHYFADWTVVPGRDAKWAEIQRKNLGEMRFAQEFACAFLGSSNTVVNVDILKNLFETVKSEPDIVDLNGRLKIYERPIKGATYVLGVDPSKGVGKDDSVVQILKVGNLDPIHVTQVAVFKDNKTDTYEFSELVNRLSYYYNNARIFIENNAEGAPVVSHLWWTYENMNLYAHGSDPGIRASKSTKTKAVLLMKRLLENYQLVLHDQETVKQLGSFIENKGKFYGKDLPDDLVSGLYWACFAFEARDIFDTTPNVINKKDEGDDAWGILSDVSEPEEDWRWLTSN